MNKSEEKVFFSAPRVIVVFFFVIFCGGAVFYLLARSSEVALLEEKPYEKGQLYQAVIDEIAAGRRSGIMPAMHFFEQKTGGYQIHVTFTPEAAGSRFGEVRLKALRPDRAALDREFILHSESPGVFAADGNLPAAGLWLFEVRAVFNGAPLLFKEQRSVP